MNTKKPKQLKTGDIVFCRKCGRLVYRIVIDWVTGYVAKGNYQGRDFLFVRDYRKKIQLVHPERYADRIEFFPSTPKLAESWSRQKYTNAKNANFKADGVMSGRVSGKDKGPMKKQYLRWFDRLMKDVEVLAGYTPHDTYRTLQCRLNRILKAMHEANEKDLSR